MSEETRIEEGEEVQGLDASLYRAALTESQGNRPRPTGHEPYDITSKRFYRVGQLGAADSTAGMAPSNPESVLSIKFLVGKLKRMIRGQINLLPVIVPVNSTTPIQLLPVQYERTYLFILNPDAAAKLFLGIGFQPNSSTGLPLFANGGAYEPIRVPINDVWCLSSVASSIVQCYYAIGNG